MDIHPILDFFQDTPFGVCYGLEGVCVIEDRFFFGCRAGPECSFTNLAHEMAHFVEIDDDRMLLPGWGLRVPSVEVCGQLCVETRTLQITEREIRVIAYQANLLEFLGWDNLEEDIDFTIKSLNFLPDFMLVPLENGIHPYSEEGKALGLSLKEIDKSRFRWTKDRVIEARKTYTMERFLSEWIRKISIIKQRNK